MGVLSLRKDDQRDGALYTAIKTQLDSMMCFFSTASKNALQHVTSITEIRREIFFDISQV